MTEPIAARGKGAENFDAPTLFYLTHQAQIDEWYALRGSVAAALDGWYRTTIRDSLAELGNSHGFDVTAVGESTYSFLLLHPPTVPVESVEPALGVGVGWSVKGTNGTSNPVYATVRCSAGPAGRAAAQAFLDVGGRQYRQATPRVYGSDNGPWLLECAVRAADDWWTGLDSYRDDIVQRVADLVVVLDGALAAGFSIDSAGPARSGA